MIFVFLSIRLGPFVSNRFVSISKLASNSTQPVRWIRDLTEMLVNLGE